MKRFFTVIFILQAAFLGAQVQTGAEQTQQYLPLLEGKTIALVVNQTSVIGNTHLVDSLLALKVKIKCIFAPEHGFRGDHEAGASVKGSVDAKTKLPLISLYGKTKKPTKEHLNGVQAVVYDIQDVGARFYTYISTMHYVMEACAENKIECIVLDRPNPNGYFVDGNILDTAYKSFVGMHPVPMAHGMTVGEYAQMINGEKWLAKGIQCPLTVVRCKNYVHEDEYKLPVKPSPNLPTMESVYLYPSLCLFEGTTMSVGRGTDKPFELIGCPNFKPGDYEFTPKKIPGVAENPPYEGKLCKGIVLTEFGRQYIRVYKRIYLYWLTEAYQQSDNKEKFFNDYFDTLAGGPTLRKQIIAGETADNIYKSWDAGLEKFRKIRGKYLLYE